MSILPDRSDRTLGRTALFAFFTILLVMAAPIWMGGLFLKDDLIAVYFPTRFLYSQALAEGHNTLWTSHMFNGFYLHGEGQVGMFHPAHFLLYRFLPLSLAFNMEVLLPYPLLFVGTFILLRHRSVSRGASLAGAFFFTLSGFNLLHMVHPSMMQVLTHLPWLLWLSDRLLKPQGGSLRYAGLFALLLGSQLLLGHPVAFWICLVAVGTNLLIQREYLSFRTLLLLTGAGTAGLLLGAIQLLPTWETAQSSWRADPVFIKDYRNLDALHPANFLQWLNPFLFKNLGIGRPFPHETGIWPGTVPLLLAAAALPLLKRSLVAQTGFSLAVLGILLSLGDQGMLYRLFSFIPFVGDFGTPNRFILLSHLGIALLAASALQEGVPHTSKRILTRSCIVFAGCSLVVTLMAATGIPSWRQEAYADIPALLLGLAFTLAGTGAVIFAKAYPRMGSAALVAVFAVSAGWYGLSYVFSMPPKLNLQQIREATAAPPAAAPARIHSKNNVLLLNGYKLSSGYGALTPGSSSDPMSATALQLAGAEWVQVSYPYAPTQEQLVYPFGAGSNLFAAIDGLGRTTIWQKVSNPMPRARFVDIPGSARVIIDEPGYMTIETEAEENGQLALTERWHPGWVCQVDETPHAPQVLYEQYLGCTVTPGKHIITFTFDPRSFRLGRSISLGALALVLLAMVWPFRTSTDTTETTP